MAWNIHLVNERRRRRAKDLPVDGPCPGCGFEGWADDEWPHEDDCPIFGDAQPTGGDMATLDQVVREAEDEGWRVGADTGDICPDCQVEQRTIQDDVPSFSEALVARSKQ